MNSITRTAINRPIFIFMLMVGAFLMGTISYLGMRKELQPDVSFGTITITTQYPGAGPDDINELVSRKIEESVAGVSGIREITSTSQEGISAVVITLELDRNVDNALSDIRSKVDASVNNLPKDVLKPEVQKLDTSITPMLNLSFSSSLSSKELRDLIDDKLADRFSQINGVASASVQGGDQREIQVRVKKDRLLSYGIGISEILQAVSAASLNAPSGHVVTDSQELSVRVKADFTDPKQIADTIISISDPKNPNAKRRTVRLSDVATIDDSTVERTAYSRLNGHDAIVLAILKAHDGNAVEITQNAEQVISSIKKEYAKVHLNVVETFNQSNQIKDSISDLNFALGFGIFLVASIVFIFLHNMRGTIIVALAIPTSIFATFVAMNLLGFTINNMSMLSLSLAIGVLVDDAIVVLENIYRHLKMGEDPRQAAINGRAEIGLAALAITFADVVVFLPIGFMGGIVGLFFKPLALGFVSATLFSLFVSFTLTPLLAARWYRSGEDMEHATGWFASGFERGFAKLQDFYRRVLEWALHHRWFVFLLGNLSLFSVIAFIAGSFVTAKAPPGVTGAAASPANFGVQGALTWAVPRTLFMMVAFVGLIVFAINYLRAKKDRRFRWTVVGVSELVGVVLAVVVKMPPMVGLFLGLAILPVICFVLNAVHPLTKSRLIPASILFALIFPLASLGGYQYAQWKGESVFKFGFMPESDAGQVQANIQLPPSSNLQDSQRVVEQIEKIMMADPDVKYVVSNIGVQGVGGFGGTNQGSNYAQVIATLYDRQALTDRLPWAKHSERFRHRSSTSVAAQFTAQVDHIPGAMIKISATSAYGFGSDIQLSFTSDDRAALLATAEAVRNGLAQGAVPGIINPDLSSKEGKPEEQIKPDRLAIADHGGTVSDYARAIQTLYQGNDDTKMRVNGREYPIRVMMDVNDRNDPDILRQVPITFNQGNPVFIPSVAKIVRAPGIDKITRRQRAEEIQVTADLLPGYANGSVTAQIQNWLARTKMVPSSVQFKPLGQADFQARESGFLFGALGLGFILVYMLLASLYDNLLYPFIIQIAQPQAMVGALLALVLMDKSLNLVGFIGIISLVGLVGKNAILLVDYTNTLRDRGRNRHDALVEAGPTRLRPIMMTTLALILGMLPVALAIGRGSEFRETIGITIIGGISLSTILTLVVIPCSYTIFDDLTLYFSSLMGKRPQHVTASESEFADPTEEDASVARP
ncbi:MAG: efflux RND transporter permease subunit [Fimbriimonas sp.]|nr:efflux RND transporter permease subunit [Fimbriimonas sp.]